MISGISSSSLYQSQLVNHYQQMRTAFQQLGSDLQSGNISAAQTDFATMTQGASTPAATSTTSGSQTSLQQEIQQLGQDLQSGNVTAVQQDYSSIQQTIQHAHAEHTHHGRQHDASPSDTSTDPFSLLTSLATTAASAYGSSALSTALTAGSTLSALV